MTTRHPAGIIWSITIRKVPPLTNRRAFIIALDILYGFNGILMRCSRALLLLLGIVPLVVSLAAQAGTLVINANASDPAPRAAWEALVAQFQREHSDVEVRLNIYDHESYKKSLRNWLTTAPPDVVFWFAGNRMRQLAGLGLFQDVSELFTDEVRRELHPSALDLVSLRGKQYGLPYAYYPVGMFYRRDLMETIGLQNGVTSWNELRESCGKLRSQGIDAIALGSRDLWPTAAWFDYLNLRLNGLRFHMDLMEGRESYLDPRVKAVFARWRELIEAQCFTTKHASASWQESQSLLYQGKAAMMLIGAYIIPNLPAAIRERMAFSAFPVLDHAVGHYEEAPMNSVHIPAGARNKTDAIRLLKFLLRGDVQQSLNAQLMTIPVTLRARPPNDPLLREGQRVLASAHGYSQFFDRDTSEELANIAMKGFQEFMLNPARLDTVLTNIDQARKRIYRH